MKNLTGAFLFAMALTGTASAQPQLQAGLSPAASIQLVAEGCGPGGHRDRFGYCRPNYRPMPPRACPPGMHLSPRGCVPNYYYR